MKIVGIKDEAAITGTSKEIFNYYGLSKENLVKLAKELIGKN